MAITRWEPFEELAPLRDAVNRLFEESFVRPMRYGLLGRTFPIDVYETESEYVVRAPLPGVKPDDIKVTAVRDILTIHAIVKPTEPLEELTEKAGTYVRRERYEGEMTRAIELPTEIQPDKVAATYEHGLLTLHIPKLVQAKPTQIKVRVTEPMLKH